MSSTKPKFTGEKPVAINRRGIPVFKSSPRQAGIAAALKKTAAYTRAAEKADAGGTGRVNGRS